MWLYPRGLKTFSLLLFVASHRPITSLPGPNPEQNVILVLDVDNTLYDENLLASATQYPGIEEQIVKNIHSFCSRHLSLSKDKADKMHHTYGNTIEGLRHTVWKKLDAQQLEKKMQHCYEQIWNDNVTYASLLLQHQRAAQQTVTTGYSHPTTQVAQLRALLQANKDKYPMYLASNSPSWHVRKVLQAMGLLNVCWTGLATPDFTRGYPTKHSPLNFYQYILQHHHNNKSGDSNIVLVDDSQTNVKMLPNHRMTGIRLERPDTPIQTAILQALGVIQPSEDYVFSQTRYLQSKNVVDAMALHRPTWTKLAEELRATLATKQRPSAFQIVDVGAGLLSMLRLILDGDDNSQLPSLIGQVSSDDIDGLCSSVEYFAYEPNLALHSDCIQTLTDLGFTRTQVDSEDQEQVFVSTKNGRHVKVHLRFYDYNVDLPPGHVQPDPQLIVGCCFADLMDPYELVPSLLHRFLSNPGSSSGHCLCYFPITFEGITQFIPPKPFEINVQRSIPSDTVAFALYSKALTDIHKHSLDPRKLVQAMKAFGAKQVASGAANWDVDPEKHRYLWQTLLYFFERVAGPALLQKGWDAAGWLQRARKPEHSPSILVSNVDLLFRMPRLGNVDIGTDLSIEDAVDQQEMAIEEIQFTGPYRVSTIQKLGVHLGPKQVQIKSEYSLISSGTELKIFKGMFDDAALDVNIKGMDNERMAYPLAYGYSLVGRVVQCGSDVEDSEELVGKLVFTFSAHATHVITERDAIQIVPDGIDAEDAIFMPSVETALSIVHDAHVRLGERVAVFGQGLIGLLVTAILCNSSHQGMDLQAPCCGRLGSKLGTVTAIDAIPLRLAASAALGSSQALLPWEIHRCGPFDVAIEVSGNAQALQAAIDNTSNQGRLVVASWYGNLDVPLKLGIEFHRSQKTIVTSQVSEIKAELSGLWTKERRFGLTWDLVKQLQPSRLVTMRTSLSDAQKAYEALDKGTEIAVAFQYK